MVGAPSIDLAKFSCSCPLPLLTNRCFLSSVSAIHPLQTVLVISWHFQTLYNHTCAHFVSVKQLIHFSLPQLISSWPAPREEVEGRARESHCRPLRSRRAWRSNFYLRSPTSDDDTFMVDDRPCCKTEGRGGSSAVACVWEEGMQIPIQRSFWSDPSFRNQREVLTM